MEKNSRSWNISCRSPLLMESVPIHHDEDGLNRAIRDPDRPNAVDGSTDLGYGHKAGIKHQNAFRSSAFTNELTMGLGNGEYGSSSIGFQKHSSRFLKMPRSVTFDFDFYKELFLNIDNDNFNVTALNLVVTLQQLANVLGMKLSVETTATILSMQNDTNGMVSWEEYLETIKSYESRERFVKGGRKARMTFMGGEEEGGSNHMHDTDHLPIPVQEELNIKQKTIIPLTRPEQAFYVFEGHGRNFWSLLISMVRLSMYGITVITLVLESIPSMRAPAEGCDSFDDTSNPICLEEPIRRSDFFYFNVATSIYFTIDFLIRLSLVGYVRRELFNKRRIIEISTTTASNTRRERIPRKFFSRVISFVFHPSSILDLASFLPFYFIIGFYGFDTADQEMWTMYAAFRVLRLAGFLRVISLRSFKDVKRILYRAIRDSGISLVILIIIYMGVILLFAILICIPERGDWYPAGSVVNGEKIISGNFYRENAIDSDLLELSPFVSVPTGMWWAVITATTVGYGDTVPSTVWGKILGGILAITGVVVLALPVAVVGLNFSNEYTRFHAIRRQLALSKDRETQERIFEQYKMQISDSSGGAEAADAMVLFRRPESVGLIQNNHPPDRGMVTEVFHEKDSTSQLLPVSLIDEARRLSDCIDAGKAVIDCIEQLNGKISDQSITESDVTNFVRIATNAIDASTIGGSESHRLRFHKIIYQIASQLIDRIYT